MVALHDKPRWWLPDSAATPETAFMDRRAILKAMGFGAVSAAAFSIAPRSLHAEDADPTADLAALAGWIRAEAPLPDFDAQCAAMIAAGPAVISSIMGVYPPEIVAQIKARGIRWFATVTTLAEARAAEAAGADAIVAQGMEAGGHRGAFAAQDAAGAMVGLMALLPAVVDAVSVPVIATGGIADARGVAAALLLGASAVQIGTGFLRAPEAQLAPAWAEAIGAAAPEGTVATRAFSGRLGRAIRTAYTDAAGAEDAPEPAPYPVQRALTAPMHAAAAKAGDLRSMQAWAGQSAALARAEPADRIVARLWGEAQALLG